jgi:hypothetical protein
MSYEQLVTAVQTLATANEGLKTTVQEVQVAVEASRDSAEAFAADALNSVTQSQAIVLQAPIDAAAAAQAVLASKTNKTDLAAPTGSSEIGFLSRSVHQALLDLVNIRTYGAVEGASCTQALIDTGLNATGVIIVPRGDFYADVSVAQFPAINALIPRIRVEGTLEIRIASGRITLTAPTHVAQNSPGKLSILGAAAVPVSILGQVSTSGAASNYTVVLTLNTVTGVAVGDYIHTYQVVGTDCPEVHRGVWEITAVNSGNNTITVRNTCRYATFPVNTITSSTSVVLKTVLLYNNCDGLVVPTAHVAKVDNIAFVGNSDSYWSSSNVSGTEKGTHGVYVGAMTIALNGKTDNVNQLGVTGGSVSFGPNVGINGFDQQGVCVELNGSVWGDFVSSCNNKRRGWYSSTAAGIRAKHITGSGNFLDGAIVDIGGCLYSSSVSVFVGNGGRGVTASHGGAVVLDTGVSMYNLLEGGVANNNGILQATSSRFSFNGRSGFSAEYGGSLIIDNAEADSNGIYGVTAAFGSNVRGVGMLIRNNVNNAARATELAFMNLSSATMTGNAGGTAQATCRGGGIILTDAGYVVEIVRGTELRAVPAGAQGVRMASTSTGDDILLGHDTVGAGTYTTALHIRSTIGVYPHTDNSQLLGRVTERWKQIVAVDSVISTSDERHKTDFRGFTDAEKAASKELASKIIIYKWKHALEEKAPEDVRSHVGMTVQTALGVMAAHGLNPMEYGMICYDEWDAEYDEEGTLIRDAGNIFSFRLAELEMFMIAGTHYRLLDLEALLG